MPIDITKLKDYDDFWAVRDDADQTLYLDTNEMFDLINLLATWKESMLEMKTGQTLFLNGKIKTKGDKNGK